MTLERNDPNLHWDGQRWLRWNDSQWVDAGTGERVFEQAQAVEPSSTQTLMIQTELATQLKQPSAAYLFWIFLGMFGAHRFYLSRQGSGIAQAILTCTIIGIVVSAPWALIDVFFIGSWIRDENNKTTQRIYSQHGLATRSAIVSTQRTIGS